MHILPQTCLYDETTSTHAMQKNHLVAIFVAVNFAIPIVAGTPNFDVSRGGGLIRRTEAHPWVSEALSSPVGVSTGTCTPDAAGHTEITPWMKSARVGRPPKVGKETETDLVSTLVDEENGLLRYHPREKSIPEDPWRAVITEAESELVVKEYDPLREAWEQQKDEHSSILDLSGATSSSSIAAAFCRGPIWPDPGMATWTLNIHNNDHTVTESVRRFNPSTETWEMYDEENELHDNTFTLIVDNQVRKRFVLNNGQSTQYQFELTSGETHVAKLVFWDGEMGTMRSVAVSKYLPADRTSTLTRTQSEDHASGNLKTAIIVLADSGPGEHTWPQWLIDWHVDLMWGCAEKMDEYFQQMSYGKLRYEPRDLFWQFPVDPDTGTYYTVDKMDDLDHDEFRTLTYTAFKDVDASYSFYGRGIQKVIYVTTTFNASGTIDMRTLFDTNDIAASDSQWQYRWGMRQGTVWLRDVYFGIAHPEAWTHEMGHTWYLGDSYFSDNRPVDGLDDSSGRTQDTFEWWGLMGGNYNGHIIGFNRWALGWLQGTIIPWQGTCGDTPIPALYSTNPDIQGAGFGDSLYMVRNNQDAWYTAKFWVIEFRLRDQTDFTLETPEYYWASGQSPLGPNERWGTIQVYEVYSDDYHSWYDSDENRRDFYDTSYFTTNSDIKTVLYEELVPGQVFNWTGLLDMYDRYLYIDWSGSGDSLPTFRVEYYS